MNIYPSATSVLTDWAFEPTIVVGLVITAGVYVAGLRELDRRGKLGRLVGPWHVTSFTLGLLAVALALLSPIDTLSNQLFYIHMFQHVLLFAIAPPLLLMGKPVPVLLVGAPHPLVRKIARTYHRTRSLRGFMHILTNPFVAWTLFSGVMLAWHLPAFYQAALNYQGVHLVEHLSYLLTGLLFWWVAIEPFPGGPRLAYGWRMLYLASAMIPGSGLGMAFLLSTSPVYSFYAALPRLWGTSALDDQAMAGLIMWLLGDTILLGGAGYFFVKMMDRFEQQSLAKAALLEQPLQVEASTAAPAS